MIDRIEFEISLKSPIQFWGNMSRANVNQLLGPEVAVWQTRIEAAFPEVIVYLIHTSGSRLAYLSRDGSMFSTLREYAAQEYYEAHPTMYLITPDCGYIVEIFVAFTASPSETGSDTSPWRVEWPDEDAFSEWLAIAAERSVISTGITVNSDDRLLTLSTCTNSGKDRFLVMGKLTAVNETE